MKKFIGLVVVLCILLCTLAVAANEPPHNIEWSIDNGVLTIKGSGAMDDFKTESDVPWNDKKGEITKIVIEEGVTHIGNMAFYGLKNVTDVSIADSVESIGLCAFHYTEGTSTSLGNLSADFQFTLESDSMVVSKGDTFTLTVTVEGDFKNVAALQTAIVYDKEIMSMDSTTCLDEEWLATINEDNLGFISEPMAGNVANNLRIAYFSLSGVSINEYSPLYTAGKTKLVVAKVNCLALSDITDISPATVMIKNSDLTKIEDGKVISVPCGENQLTYCTKLPMANITLETNSASAVAYAKENGLTVKSDIEVVEDEGVGIEKEDVAVSDEMVITNGETKIEADVAPYTSNDGCVMLPLRAILESKNISVIWDGETKTIFMANDDAFAAHQIGKKVVFGNDSNMDLQHESEAKYDRCFVSPDFFQKAFGIEVALDENTNTITIK